MENKPLTFAERVYAVVRLIPRGRVLTYKEVARRAGNPRAYRVVGTLMRRNTNWPLIPCHRVIRSDGSTGNWSWPGGRKRKIALLRRERAR